MPIGGRFDISVPEFERNGTRKIDSQFSVVYRYTLTDYYCASMKDRECIINGNYAVARDYSGEKNVLSQDLENSLKGLNWLAALS